MHKRSCPYSINNQPPANLQHVNPRVSLKLAESAEMICLKRLVMLSEGYSFRTTLLLTYPFIAGYFHSRASSIFPSIPSPYSSALQLICMFHRHVSHWRHSMPLDLAVGASCTGSRSIFDMCQIDVAQPCCHSSSEALQVALTVLALFTPSS